MTAIQLLLVDEAEDTTSSKTVEQVQAAANVNIHHTDAHKEAAERVATVPYDLYVVAVNDVTGPGSRFLSQLRKSNFQHWDKLVVVADKRDDFDALAIRRSYGVPVFFRSVDDRPLQDWVWARANLPPDRWLDQLVALVGVAAYGAGTLGFLRVALPKEKIPAQSCAHGILLSPIQDETVLVFPSVTKARLNDYATELSEALEDSNSLSSLLVTGIQSFQLHATTATKALKMLRDEARLDVIWPVTG